MAHVSLYRKWRPQTFADVTGQEHVVRTLGNALSQGRIAHAYLFSGPRGTGKTTVARLLAKGLNCSRGPTAEPCNACEACERITRGTSLDVTEIDGASNRGIDEIREVRENIRFSPSEGRYRIYIIDEIHMLTAEAFNALLKVLEEPPAHGVFIFATTEPHKVPATVLSRCQRFDFRPLFSGEIRERLAHICRAEGIQWVDPALDLIARHADGGLRDALSTLDQCAAFGDGLITPEGVEQVIGAAPRQWFHRITEMMLRGDTGEAFRLVADLRSRGNDLRQFARDAARHLRDLLILSGAPDARSLVEVPPEEREVMERQARELGVERLLEGLSTLLRAEADMRWAPNGQLVLEMALLRLSRWEAKPAPPAAATVPAAPAASPAPASVSPAGIQASAPAPAPRTAPPAAPAPPPVRPTPPPAASAAGPDGAPSSAPAGLGSSPGPGPSAEPRGKAPAAAPLWAAPAPSTEKSAALLAEVEAAWPRILARLREARQPKTAAFLIEGRPVSVEPDGVLIVEFPPERRFHRDSFERGRHRTYVEKAIVDVLGRPLHVKTRVRGDEPEAPPEGGADRPARGSGLPSTSSAVPEADRGTQGSQGRPEGSAGRLPPAVEETLEVFGGRVVAVERTGDER